MFCSNDSLMNEIHIFRRFESSTRSRMNGLTTLINSQMGVLHVTLPVGSASTFVPDGPVKYSVTIFVDSSVRARLAGTASTSFTWFAVIASGTGMFKSCSLQREANKLKPQNFVQNWAKLKRYLPDEHRVNCDWRTFQSPAIHWVGRFSREIQW